MAGFSRRHFLALCAASQGGTGGAGKALRGIFPIAQSPFSLAGRLDLEELAGQVPFLDRCGAHGAVWPQLASEWDELTEQERLDGGRSFAEAGKTTRLAILLGVQSADPATAVRFARQAEQVGADAVIALPPPNTEDERVLLDYYRKVGSATKLPLFAQAVGKVSPEFLLELYRAIPTLRYIKDEAGQPLDRVSKLRRGSHDELKIFSGSHGRTLIEEMRRGFSGCMPAAGFADLYAQTWNLWHAGQHREAMDMHGRTLLVLTEMGPYGLEGLKYPLVLRGVFKTWTVRQKGRGLTEEGRRSIREAWAFVGPYLRA